MTTSWRCVAVAVAVPPNSSTHWSLTVWLPAATPAKWARHVAGQVCPAMALTGTELPTGAAPSRLTATPTPSPAALLLTSACPQTRRAPPVVVSVTAISGIST